LTGYAYYSTHILIVVAQCVTVLNVNYQGSKLRDHSKTQHYVKAVHNCKNISLCVKAVE